MWDGDPSSTVRVRLKRFCSKPTVWDGDFLISFWEASWAICSKPAVWDGDIKKAIGTITAPIRCYEPTAWDEDYIFYIPTHKGCEFVLNPPCGMATLYRIWFCKLFLKRF